MPVRKVVMKLDKKTWIAIGVFATIGVTGLAIMYRKEIAALLTGGAYQRMNAVRIAKKEWDKWNKDGKIKEHNSKTIDELNEYWKSVGRTYEGMKYQPWSAAFISYVMKNAGLGDNFKYSAMHSTYITKSIQNEKENKGRVRGLKPEDIELKEGYLVCYGRASGSSANYNTTGSYESHCDVVVEIDKREGFATTIGGNVSDSVSKTKVPITKKGKIDPVKGKKYFVVIKY